MAHIERISSLRARNTGLGLTSAASQNIRTSVTINLTDRQATFAEMAVADVVDHFTWLASRGLLSEFPPMPSLDGVILTLPSHEDVLADLLARLESDTPNQDENTPSIRAALSLATKIRAVTGFAGPSY